MDVRHPHIRHNPPTGRFEADAQVDIFGGDELFVEAADSVENVFAEEEVARGEPNNLICSVASAASSPAPRSIHSGGSS
jgi:hypothetical protein